MFHKHNDPDPGYPPRRAPAARLRAQLSFANVAAGLALFIALGGTATAAVALDRDSVGAPQIRQDAVRSPEITTDAVRSPEILGGAVRSSELRDGGVKAVDISAAAQAALRADVRFAKDDNGRFTSVPTCETQDLSVCPDHLLLELAADAPSRTAPPQTPDPDSNWLVQAKLQVTATREPPFFTIRCGLVNTRATGPAAVLDQVTIGATLDEQITEQIALTAMVRKPAGDPTIALRCTKQPNDSVIPKDAKITALEVGTVTAP